MGLRKTLLVCSAVLGLWTAGPARAAVYYVSPRGDDAAAGTADMHVIVSDPKTTSSNITIRNNLITNTAAFGINSPSFSDNHWTIQGNTISQTGETGVTFRGSSFTVVGNVIDNTGLQPS